MCYLQLLFLHNHHPYLKSSYRIIVLDADYHPGVIEFLVVVVVGGADIQVRRSFALIQGVPDAYSLWRHSAALYQPPAGHATSIVVLELHQGYALLGSRHHTYGGNVHLPVTDLTQPVEASRRLCKEDSGKKDGGGDVQSSVRFLSE